MSLKFFHIFFIVASLLLSVGLGLWSMDRGWDGVWPVLWFSTGAALALYLVWFVQKMKKAGR